MITFGKELAFSCSTEHEYALEYAPPLLGTRRALTGVRAQQGVLIRAPKSIRSRTSNPGQDIHMEHGRLADRSEPELHLATPW